eukprot:4138734-Prymnesium_polylepis.1
MAAFRAAMETTDDDVPAAGGDGGGGFTGGGKARMGAGAPPALAARGSVATCAGAGAASATRCGELPPVGG